MKYLIAHLVAIFLLANPLVIQAQCCCINHIETSHAENKAPVETCGKNSCCAVKNLSSETQTQTTDLRAASCHHTLDCCCFVGKSKTSYLLAKIVKYDSEDVLQRFVESNDSIQSSKSRAESWGLADALPPENSLNILYCVCLE